MGRSVLAGVLLAFLASAAMTQPVSRAKAQTVLNGLAMPLIENRGHYAPQVRFYAQASGRTVFFTAHGVTFRFAGEPSWTVKLSFVGGRTVAPVGEAQSDTVVSYFRGGGNSQAGLRTFERITYHDVWPGIDVVYKVVGSRLKYDVIVRPGADPTQARFRYTGADRIARTAAGGLRVITPAGEVEEEPPVVFQPAGDEQESVDATLIVDDGADGCEVAFQLGDYDRTRPLVIDPPMLIYCGYVGGALTTFIWDAAVDAQGALYVVGYTLSDETTFPVTVGPDLTHSNPPSPAGVTGDAFVAKVKPDGTGLAYCGYIGGLGWDLANGVAVDATGAAYVVGWTGSLESNFPVTGGPGLSHKGSADGFIAKVRPDGTGLVYCGYIGGSSSDELNGVAVDSFGAAYVVGFTYSDETSLPVKVGPFLKLPGVQSTYVARVKPDGSGLDYCGYIGGVGRTVGEEIAVDPVGAAYVIGSTSSDESSFPVLVGPDLTYNGTTTQFLDGFVAKIKPSGSGLDYCGFVGGNYGAFVLDVAVDRAGRAYLCGNTGSTEATFPVRVGPSLTHRSPGTAADAFVGRLRPDGTGWEYLGYIGGTSNEGALAIGVDASGRATVAGATLSGDFPVVGASTTHLGKSDAFVARVDPRGTALEYSVLIGSPSDEGARAGAIDELGNHVWIAGATQATQTQFPVRVGPDLTHNVPGGGQDQFVAKFAITDLTIGGTPNVGGRVTLQLLDDPGLVYQIGSSLGDRPIAIGSRPLRLTVDPLLLLSISGVAPQTFLGYSGVLDGQGNAVATLRIPNQPALTGVTIYSAFVTFKPGAPQGIQSISNTESFRIN